MTGARTVLARSIPVGRPSLASRPVFRRRRRPFGHFLPPAGPPASLAARPSKLVIIFPFIGQYVFRPSVRTQNRRRTKNACAVRRVGARYLCTPRRKTRIYKRMKATNAHCSIAGTDPFQPPLLCSRAIAYCTFFSDYRV